MNYQETTLYLYNQLPMFEKDGQQGYKEGLQNTIALDEHFGHPHRDFLTIHVAGTNGKGSCAHTLAAILQTCGYKVGLYTSPHLVDFRERIRINGRPITEQYVIDFVEQERAFFEPLHPTFFELTTAMAFKYFSESHIDIAVVEVGLGGRLDCTNIITPILSVITNISFDHTQLLGDTLEKIAAEKAGIIKSGIPVVIGEATPETRPVFEAKAQELQAPICFAEDAPEVVSAQHLQDGSILYETKQWGQLTGELGGFYQEKNTNTILCAVHKLMELGYLCECENPENIAKCATELKEAFAHVSALTGLAGRWQLVKTTPRVVCDTGHNVAGWQYLSEQLKNVDCRQMHIIFGMVNDKDVHTVFNLLPKDAIYYFTKPQNKRAISEQELLQLGQEHHLTCNAYPDVETAYKMVMDIVAREDFVFVGGSSYLVADFLKTCI